MNKYILTIIISWIVSPLLGLAQLPLSGLYPTNMGIYRIDILKSNNAFIGSNTEQETVTPLSELQLAQEEISKITAPNSNVIATQIYNKYKIKKESITVDLFINNQGKAILTWFVVDKNHTSNNFGSYPITATQLADMEDMINKFTFQIGSVKQTVSMVQLPPRGVVIELFCLLQI